VIVHVHVPPEHALELTTPDIESAEVIVAEAL
jgi:hypothetical protein